MKRNTGKAPCHHRHDSDPMQKQCSCHWRLSYAVYSLISPPKKSSFAHITHHTTQRTCTPAIRSATSGQCMLKADAGAASSRCTSTRETEAWRVMSSAAANAGRDQPCAMASSDVRESKSSQGGGGPARRSATQ
jgi:hypothetical protein